MNYKRYYNQCKKQCEIDLDIEIKKHTSCFYKRGYVFYESGEIGIKETKDYVDNLISLFHEQTHAEHDKNRCKCMKLNSHCLAEYHALRGVLEKAYRTKDKMIIKAAISTNNNYIEMKVTGYISAAKKAKKLKIYRKCLDFVKK